MAVTVFISYAHRDKRLRDRLASHLSMLRHNGLITDWDDGQLVPGEEWEPTILTRLNTAQLILLLISADFLDSDFCYHTEMKRALERHELGEAIVLPIILSPVHWQSSPLAKLEVLPSRAQPVTAWHLQDTEGAVESDSPLQEIVQDAFTFNQALAALFKYSLIRRDPHTETFTVHRLIQVVIKDNMERELQHQWAERVVKAVNSVFPSGDFETWSRCQILLPHALNCVGLIAKWQLNLKECRKIKC